ncbi:hypothetical protein [Moraxella catarrhalis]|uniref:Uncharacterized protein n=1 Tax=Moraxella catarrhalis TaxID=480 RepID=A0A198UMN4_MORCA|nr:hypothetical protein [Moraxella catarrhalis]OAU97549.1 hypothetical protein AO384_0585 [Moraxella catarrhalis]OAU98831.1 hypothetical protein AO383_0397 [Moraxella catarrhalis]OAV02922.1 hypothetical protein AO385_0767 [Moraxella catarrhalis]
MKGYKKGEVWIKTSTGDEVMIVRTIDNYVYFYRVKENRIGYTKSEAFIINYCPKRIVNAGDKQKLLALDILISEFVSAFLVILCILLLVMANIALFRFLIN